MELKAAASDGMLLYAAQRANQAIQLIIFKCVFFNEKAIFVYGLI